MLFCLDMLFRQAGFMSRANAFSLALLMAPFLSPAVFRFSSFILWVGVVGLGSPD